MYIIRLLHIIINKPTHCQQCPILGPHTPINVLTDPPIREHIPLPTPQLHREQSAYMMIGYLINTSDRSDVWKLMALRIDRRQAEFYVESSNRKLDVKVPLTYENAKSADGSGIRPFRDIYDIPDLMIINHPMFNQNQVYEFVKLKT